MPDPDRFAEGWALADALTPDRTSKPTPGQYDDLARIERFHAECSKGNECSEDCADARWLAAAVRSLTAERDDLRGTLARATGFEPFGLIWRPKPGSRRWQHRTHREGRAYPATAEIVDVFRVVPADGATDGRAGPTYESWDDLLGRSNSALGRRISDLEAELAEARAATPEPLFTGHTCGYEGVKPGAVLLTIEGRLEQGRILDGTEVAVCKIEGGGDEAPCVPGSPSDASKATTVAVPTPEPLAVGKTLVLPEGDHHSKVVVPGPVPIPPGTEFVVMRADQLPAAVTRQQVLQAVGAGFTTAYGPDQETCADVVEHITDAVWARLRGEGSG